MVFRENYFHRTLRSQRFKYVCPVSADTLPSSRKVNRPIWGNSLKVSRQMVPAVRRRAMQTWSCLTNRGRVLLFSPVFLSTRQIKAWRRSKEKKNVSRYTVRIQNIHLFLHLHYIIPTLQQVIVCDQFQSVTVSFCGRITLTCYVWVLP